MTKRQLCEKISSSSKHLQSPAKKNKKTTEVDSESRTNADTAHFPTFTNIKDGYSNLECTRLAKIRERIRASRLRKAIGKEVKLKAKAIELQSSQLGRSDFLSLRQLGIIGFLPLLGSTSGVNFQHFYSTTVVNKSTVRHKDLENVTETTMSLLYVREIKERNCALSGVLSTFVRGSTSALRLDETISEVRMYRRRACTGRIKKSGSDSLTDIVVTPDILPSVARCRFCNAYRFIHETDAFCCGNGTVCLEYVEPPSEVYELLTDQTEESKEFQRYIRVYNNMMAFTSLGVKYDKSLATAAGTSIYTFRVQGQMHHFINNIVPTDSKAEYLQLYFYDPSHELENQTNINSAFNPSIVQKLISISEINPYSRFFRSLRDEPNLGELRIIIKADVAKDRNVYNLPTQDEVALIWRDSTDNSDLQPRDIIIFGNDTSSYRIQYYFACYDPLQYFLLHPRGEPGWHAGIEKTARHAGRNFCTGESLLQPRNFNVPQDLIDREIQVLGRRKETRSKVATREYYAYKFQMRPLQRNLFHCGGRLFQQFIIDMYVKIETARLDFFRYNQKQIKADLYQGLVQALATGETSASNVGRRIILPATFIGGPRDMTRRYLDAMALVRKYCRPDLFLTMTCNPYWLEITDHLIPGQIPQNRPDLLSRVFKAKLMELKNEITVKGIFGPVVAYVHVIEFQKRGLPHAHMLIVLNKSAKLTNPSTYDRIVSAEIPDPYENFHLHDMVQKHMMHGPCGILDLNCSCMKNGKCKSKYPKRFQEETIHDDNEYPLYRRPDNGRTVFVRNHHLHNGYVVPHNPYLLAKFNCHINVEVCSTIKAVKYLYKYIYKGHDRIAFDIINDKSINGFDEIKAFQSSRWVAPPEAAWRIFAFALYGMNPSVLSLHLHLEGEQFLTFDEESNLNRVISSDIAAKTMLTEFFHMNSTNTKAKANKYLYQDFPEDFVWDYESHEWYERKARMCIGRMNCVSPSEGERYYLRLLLTQVRGPTSFQSLLSYNGQVAATFKEAVVMRGLILADNHINSCLEEASILKMPAAFRQLFCSLLVFCNPVNARELWAKYEHDLSEDFLRSVEFDNAVVRKQTLNSIAKLLQSMGKDIMQYGIIDNLDELSESDEGKEIRDELNLQISEEDLKSHRSLNLEQRLAYDAILAKVRSNEPSTFFIDGPGGTGKTYLYRSILATVRAENKIALATASSGVAASLLPGGQTAHSRFKIPIDFNVSRTCNVGKRSGLADLLRKTSLIIWDEASMANKQIIEAVNAMLMDITSTDIPFGGKVMVFGGDFRQILPVVRFGEKDKAINSTILKSRLWPIFHKLRLVTNMRASQDPSFCEYLMRIGNGTEPTNNSGQIKIPNSMLISSEHQEDVVDKLIESV